MKLRGYTVGGWIFGLCVLAPGLLAEFTSRAESPLRKPEEIAQGDKRRFVGARHAGLD